MDSFSKKTIDSLKYYVYVYSDPDTRKPFYVGKGKGNRVFSHLHYDNDSDKVAYIKELQSKGKNPLIEILVHGVDENTALKVEAAAIDLIGIENLTNIQRGHHSGEYGKIEVSLIESRYNYDSLSLDDFEDDVVLIKINKVYRNDMSPHELYEATRGYWRVNIDNARKAKYAIAVYYGMILEVYKIIDWYPAFSTMMNRTIDESDKTLLKNRYEFIGNIASEDVRKRYRNKSVSSVFEKGEQNPIKYIINNNEIEE